MDLGIQDKVFLITGGTSGLGLAAARCLIGEGARAVVSSPNEQSVEKAVAELGGTDQAVGVVADNADPDSAGRLVGAALDRFGRPDGLLVSVGGPPTGPIIPITDDQWHEPRGHLVKHRDPRPPDQRQGDGDALLQTWRWPLARRPGRAGSQPHVGPWPLPFPAHRRDHGCNRCPA